MKTGRVPFLSMLSLAALVTANPSHSQTITYPSKGSNAELPAAKEVRRSIFIRTGTATALAKVADSKSLPAGDVIVASENSRPIITELKQHYGDVDAPASSARKGYRNPAYKGEKAVRAMPEITQTYGDDSDLTQSTLLFRSGTKAGRSACSTAPVGPIMTGRNRSSNKLFEMEVTRLSRRAATWRFADKHG